MALPASEIASAKQQSAMTPAPPANEVGGPRSESCVEDTFARPTRMAGVADIAAAATLITLPLIAYLPARALGRTPLAAALPNRRNDMLGNTSSRKINPCTSAAAR
jgi:hypothetical protein